jgi:non-ribosomal peptide synthetase component F
MTLLAAFQTLLYRYTGQEDICIGTPIANRNRSEIEPLIGFFVNTLVMRARFADNLTFCQLLQQVRETSLNAYANQDLPFELLVDALHPERNLSHSPLFQVMMAWQNGPTQPLLLPELSLHPCLPQKIVPPSISPCCWPKRTAAWAARWNITGTCLKKRP